MPEKVFLLASTATTERKVLILTCLNRKANKECESLSVLKRSKAKNLRKTCDNVCMTLGARMLLGAPGLTTRNKKLLETRIRIESN